MAINPTPINDRDSWNALVIHLPGHHLLQSWQWGDLKSHYGWEVERWVWFDDENKPVAAAQLLHRSSKLKPLPFGFTLSYCPRGPVLNWADVELRSVVLDQIRQFASQRRASFLKIDPEIITSLKDPDQDLPQPVPQGREVADWLQSHQWRLSPEQIQFRNTATLDLNKSEDELLAAMKQKTRYNVRLASRKGITVRRGYVEDLDLIYHMYAETSLRDGFVIRPPDYYRIAWGEFIQAGLARPLIAEFEGQPVAAVVVYRFGEKATYLYGMSREIHREKMPTHLLQWEAIRWAKSQGCQIYDFWGAPDELDESDPMWGVYRFKQGFAPTTQITPGAWDFVLKPLSYWVYSRFMPLMLEIMRRRGRRQTRQAAQAFDQP